MTTKKTKYYFHITALALFGIAFMIHVLSVVNVPVQEYIPFVWGLHLGVFVVFFPAIIFLIIDSGGFDNKQTRSERAAKNRKKILKLFQTAPRWLSVLVVVVFIYAIMNMFLFMSSQLGGPDIINGEIILKKIDKAEYLFYRTNELRGFSGHWLVFFGISALTLYTDRKTFID